MLNKKLDIIITLSLLGAVTVLPEAISAVEYNGSLNATTAVEAEIISPDTIIIPPIDPENPNPPIDPENPEQGEGLSLVYVSNLNFGSTYFDLDSGQTLIATLDSGINEGGEEVTFENMATVMDIRGSRQNGWRLQVSQTAELFVGATITMFPRVSENNLAVTTPDGELILNNDLQEFASSSGSSVAGIISLGMGNVTLNVPAATGVGEYKTTLNWQLVSEPLS